ncbi:tetratricopeptide repeat protein [Acidobacteriota bacterium]
MFQQGEFAAALQKYTQVIKTLDFDVDARVHIQLLMKISLCKWISGDYEESRKDLENAFDRAKAIENEDLIKEIHANLEIYRLYEIGRLRFYIQKNKDALEFLNTALLSAHELGNGFYALTIQKLMGQIYLTRDELTKFLDLTESNLNISEAMNHTKEKIDSLINMGVYFTKEKEFTNALHYFYTGLKEAQQRTLKQRESICLSSLGNIYLSLGKYEIAINVLEDAISLDTASNIQVNLYNNLNKLGYIYKKRASIKGNKKDYERSLFYFIECLLHAREENNRITEIALLGNIGDTYLELGNLDKALDYFDRGLRISESKNNDVYMLLAINKAKALYNKGEPSRAEELYLETLDQAETISESSLLSHVYIGLGDIYLTQNKLERSIYYYERSLSAIRKTKLKIFSDESKNRFLLSNADVYSRLVTTYHRMFQQTGEIIYLTKMFYLAEDKKSSSFFETHNLRDKIIESGRFKELTQISEQVENQYLSHLESTIGENKQIQDSKLIEEISLEREIAYSALMSALFKKTEFETDTIIPIPHKDIQTDILDDKTAVIEYFLGEKESYVFFLSQTEFYVSPIPSKQKIETAVSGYLNFLSSPEIDVHKANKSGEEVYSVLLSWMEDSVPNSITDLIIVPDGILNLLPFDTIPKQKNNENNEINYLIYDYTISTVPSVSLLFHLKATDKIYPYQKELLFVETSCDK